MEGKRRIGAIDLFSARQRPEKEKSTAVTDPAIIARYAENPYFPFLVSFPRTGSHWLRMLMELYFRRPLLVRIFYYHDSSDYLALHTHDLELDVYRKNIVYLYRNPAPTIYSQMTYQQQKLSDIKKIGYWADLYGKHLEKWLVCEDVSEIKTVIRYENLVADLDEEFRKIARHFHVEFDKERLQEISNLITRKAVKDKTPHDPQVINAAKSYSEDQEEFLRKYTGMINDIVFSVSPDLENWFRE